MKIFITSHNSTIGGGISVAHNIISALKKVGPEHDYFFSIPDNLGYEDVCKALPNHQYIILKRTHLIKRWYWETFKLPRIIEMYNPDVIFNMANRGFLPCKIPQATFIQDPHLYYPNKHFGQVNFIEQFKFLYHRSHLRRSLKYTSVLLCLTDVAAKRINAFYKIQLCIALSPFQLLLFTSSSFKLKEVPAFLKDQKKLKLFVLTRYYAHKNLEIIVDLVKTYKEQLKDVLFILTINENEHIGAAKLIKEIKKYNLSDHIVTVGTLKYADLPSYFQHIDALFLPTLLESYSGTYVEAMHYKKPILTSDFDFARHICGKAALYYNPNEVDDICNVILRLKDEPNLYSQLVEEGQTRLKSNFSDWHEITKNILFELQKLYVA